MRIVRADSEGLEVATVMARSYAACLGLIAFVICIIRGLIISNSPDGTLSHALVMLLVFAPVGYFLGWIADGLIRQSVEANFRRALKKAQERVSS